MASQRWTYQEAPRRYRDVESGRYLSKRQVLKARNDFISGARDHSDALIRSLANRSMTLPTWVTEMRAVTARSHTAEYLLGRGGRNVMTPADWGRVGAALREQYRYIDAFAQDLGRGTLTVDQAIARGRLYTDSAVNAFERGRVAAFGMPDLPAYPGDGRTPCLMACRCYWDIVETRSQWKCTWRLGPVTSEHCDGCRTRASTYAPYTISRSTATVERHLRRVS